MECHQRCGVSPRPIRYTSFSASEADADLGFMGGLLPLLFVVRQVDPVPVRLLLAAGANTKTLAEENSRKTCTSTWCSEFWSKLLTRT